MMKTKKLILLFASFICGAAVIAGLIYFKFKGEPVIQGFYCGDNSIDKPYRSSTVPFYAAAIAFPCIALCCFVYGEFFHQQQGFKTQFANVVFLVIFYLYGAGITMFITDVGKYSIGRLRPNFYDVCKPDWSTLNCTNERGAKNYFVGDEFCNTAKKDLDLLKQARVSFPSGHASFSVYCSAFLVLYLERHVYFEYSQWEVMPKLFFQTGIGAGGLYVGLSRISDFKHHVTDVVAGSALGILIAVLMHLSTVKFIPPRNSRNVSKDQQKMDELKE